MKYVISFDLTVQVAHDKWDRTRMTMLGDDDTTLGQIKEWQLRWTRGLTQNGTLKEHMLITTAEEYPQKKIDS
jgi:hypothetical protein